MHVISFGKIREFCEHQNQAEGSLKAWYTIMNRTKFKDFNDLRLTFPSADQVNNKTVFNIAGNKYRLIAAIHYNRGKVYIRDILTHAEYDKNKWRQ